MNVVIMSLKVDLTEIFFQTVGEIGGSARYEIYVIDDLCPPIVGRIRSARLRLFGPLQATRLRSPFEYPPYTMSLSDMNPATKIMVIVGSVAYIAFNTSVTEGFECTYRDLNHDSDHLLHLTELECSRCTRVSTEKTCHAYDLCSVLATAVTTVTNISDRAQNKMYIAPLSMRSGRHGPLESLA